MTKIPTALAVFCTLTLILTLPSAPAGAADWPQYRGPGRDGVSPETGLLETWPEKGPAECWRRPLGEGFSGIAVVNGGLYTMYSDGTNELALKLDPKTGEELWNVPVGPHFDEALGNGPRSTPTVEGDAVYVLSSTGNLKALSTKDGSTIWETRAQDDLGAPLPLRGFAPSPLVHGDLLILELGAGPGKSIHAFEKATGKIAWSVRDNPPGYSSPVVATIGGVEQIVFVHSAGNELVSVLPDGTPHWTHPWEGGTLAMPLVLPPDRIFVSASADVGAMVVQVTETQDGPQVEELWRDRGMKNHWSSSVFYEGVLYGFDNGTFKALDPETGEMLWAHRGLGKGSLIAADGQLIVLGDRGDLVLVEATPEEYRQKGEIEPLGRKTWTAPSLADGRLFLRDMDEIVCLEVSRG